MKKIILLAFAAFSALFVSCSKTGPTGPAGASGPAGPNLTGNLEGYVELYDQYGVLVSPANGVSVTVPGRSSTDTTSATGMYTIHNLSTGTYELDFAKTGYGNAKVVSLNFVGGGTQYIQNHTAMAQPPSFTLSNVTLTVVGSQVTCSVTAASTDTKARKAILFLSNAPGVSSDPATYLGYTTVNIAANSANGAGTISNGTLNGAGIVSGNTLYVAAYPISGNTSASVYADIATGRQVFNNISGTALTATVTVP
jgi:hypothetical protein